MLGGHIAIPRAGPPQQVRQVLVVLVLPDVHRKDEKQVV